jgi:hypothetical protein
VGVNRAVVRVAGVKNYDFSQQAADTPVVWSSKSRQLDVSRSESGLQADAPLQHVLRFARAVGLPTKLRNDQLSG